MGKIDVSSFTDFITVLAGVFGVSPILVAFVVGGILVSLVLGITGRIAFRMRVWKNTAAAAYQTQQAYTIQTPYQVVQASQAAQWKLLGCRTLLLLGLVVTAALCLIARLGWKDQALALAGQIIHQLLGH